MSIGDALVLVQTIVLAVTLLLIAWQTRELRVTIQNSALQDIVDKFFRIVEKPEFKSHFSFGNNNSQAADVMKGGDVLCSMAFALLEQLHLQLRNRHLSRDVGQPWMEFIKCWLDQREMKAYWLSSGMICPKAGFDKHFRHYVDKPYEQAQNQPANG